MLDVFRSDAFSLVSLTASINREPYLPGLLGALGLFDERGILTTTAVVEERDMELSLIATSPRGSPPSQQVDPRRRARALTVPHLARIARVYADELLGVRAFGTEDQHAVAQQVLDQKLQSVNRSLDMTLENMRLGAVKGIVTDADGSTLYNLFTEFGVSQLAEVNFELNVATANVQKKCLDMIRRIAKEANIGGMPFEVHAICSPEFYNDLITHPTVAQHYLNWQAAEALREARPYDRFRFANITFWDYRSSDDGAVGVAAGKAHFFPVGIPGLFLTVFAPADRFDSVGSLGLPRYALPTIDDRGRYLEVEVQSNPLSICTRPRVLVQARAS